MIVASTTTSRFTSNRMTFFSRTLMRAPSRVFRRHVATGILSVAAIACGDSTAPGAPSNPATETYATSLGVNISQMTKVSDNLYSQDLVVGTGTTAVNGKNLGVTYTGWFVNGTQFETNVGGQPFTFVLGFGNVIEGWDKGLVGMKVGGKRRLVIGSALGYGVSGRGSIPPNTTLVFDVQLLSAQ
jgi:FKBP-type peptidyl-prolyl cis-trans isomerase FkpA